MTEPTLKELIKIEHTRAELQRLEEGSDGCGCSDCQELYKTLDLAKYGSRVIRIDGIVMIKEKRREKADNGSPLTDSLPLQDKKERVAKIEDDKTVVHNTQTAKKAIMQHRGRPQKPPSEPVNRSTAWRRQQKVRQSMLILT